MIGYQKAFIGGLNQLADNASIGVDEYEWLINARQRFSNVEPINKHVRFATPAGNMQGGIGIGNVKIIFVEGKAYYQEDGQSGWTNIPNFQMSADVEQIWSVAIPASTMTFVRKAAANISAPLVLTTDFKVAGTPAGVLCQDGENQPFLIEFDFVNQIYISRVTKGYNDWSNVGIAANTREYVPIGRQMMMINQTLHIVARDGKSVMRSITGRPLDFMVNVREDGTKQPNEILGGAATVAYAMDFDEITCLVPLNIPDSFIYATAHNTRIVNLDYTNTIFGEPTVRTTAIISAGIVNQYSFVELIGDYAFIDAESIKSFDAVQLLKFKGKNSIFSQSISRLFFSKALNRPVKQTNCSCITFDNYALFNVDTNNGNFIAVYDMILEKFTGFDITAVFKVKRFFTIETPSQIKLFAITVRNELYQMFGSSTEKEIPLLKTRAWTVDDTRTEHKTVTLRLFFDSATYEGNVEVTEIVDEQISPDNLQRNIQELKATTAGIPYPVRPPVFPNNKSQTDNPVFTLTTGLTGKKISFFITWNNDAHLHEYQLDSSEQKGLPSLKQKDLTNKLTYGS